MNSPGGYVYVLHGEDTFSRDEQVRALKEQMRSRTAGEHNLTELAGAEATVAALRAAADTMPFLAERRMVIVHGLLGGLQGKGGAPRRKPRGTATGAGSDEMDALLAYLPTLPATTYLALVEGKGVNVDAVARAIPSGRGIVRAYDRVADVPRWIRGRAGVLNVDLDEGAVRELSVLGGEDLRRLDQELRKLAAFADGTSVTREDVRELVVARDILTWSMLDALAERRQGAAIVALRRLLEQGDSPEALLLRDLIPLYRRLLAAREVSALDRRQRAGVDVAALGLNPRTLPRTQEQASHFQPAELEQALALLLDLDRAVKTGDTEAEPALEVTLVRLCSRLSTTAAA